MNELTKEQAEEAWLHAVAIISGKHSPAALEAEFGEPQDAPIDLSTIDPANIEDYVCHRVLPTPDIAKYLASGDALTDATIDHMEEAMATAYGLKPPYSIASFRNGKEGENLGVDWFYLLNEEG